MPHSFKIIKLREATLKEDVKNLKEIQEHVNDLKQIEVII